MTRKIASVVVAGILLFAVSCKDDDNGLKVSSSQSAAVQDASTSDAYFSDASDMSTSAVAQPQDDQFSGKSGRTDGTIALTITGDTRFTGAEVVLVTSPNSTVLVPQGTITIDFGTGQTDASGTVRKGIINIVYNGWRFIPKSYYVISFVDYYINGTKVEGVRTVTTASITTSSVTFNVTDAAGKLIFADGTTATRESVHTRTWTKSTTALTGQWAVSGAASGTTSDGKTYAYVTSRDLVFKAQCALSKIYIASEGEAVLTVDNVPITLNYGVAGAACDNVVTVSIGGSSSDVTIK